MSKVSAKRGRPANAENKRWVVSALENVSSVSYFHKRQLVEQGYLVATNVPRETRGRPEVTYTVSAKGKNLVRLAAFWPK